VIIHHLKDEILDFSDNALKAKELTNCTVVPISGFLLGGAHQLFSDEVLIKSINWFELHFFDSSMINGPIIITYYLNYALIITNIILLFTMLISLISVSSRIFFRENKDIKNIKLLDNNFEINSTTKRKQFIKIILFTIGFLLSWLLFESIFGMLGLVYSSIGMIFIYMIIRIYKYLNKSNGKIKKSDLKKNIKTQFRLKYIAFSICFVSYFILIYMIFSFYYPFGFIWPSNFVVHFIMGYLVFPVFLSIELLLRKVIYPKLIFIKHKNKVLITIAIIIIICLMLMTQKLSFFPSVLFMYVIFLLVILLNTKIFQNVKSFYPIVLISFSIVQIFFATVLSNAIGVSMVI